MEAEGEPMMCIKECGREATGKYGRYCPECRSMARRKPVKYNVTPEIDALITEAWRTGHGTGAAQFVAHKTGWPKWKVARRAVAIGVARRQPKEPYWSAAEVEVLEKFGWMCEDRIAMKLLAICGTKRTRAAIQLKKKRLKLRVSDLSGYSARRLGDLMGVESKKVSHQWIKFGWLKAVRRGQDRTPQQGGDVWWIDHKDVYKFVLAHPEEIDLGRVDRLWFLDLVTRGKIGVQDVEAAA